MARVGGTHVVRIGGGSAGFGDGAMAAPRLVAEGRLDYLMFDFLSEYYMPIAGRLRRCGRGRRCSRKNVAQQVLPAARATTSLGRVLGHSAPKMPCARRPVGLHWRARAGAPGTFWLAAKTPQAKTSR
mgnify:CR=1 FL=1